MDGRLNISVIVEQDGRRESGGMGGVPKIGQGDVGHGIHRK